MRHPIYEDGASPRLSSSQDGALWPLLLTLVASPFVCETRRHRRHNRHQDPSDHIATEEGGKQACFYVSKPTPSSEAQDVASEPADPPELVGELKVRFILGPSDEHATHLV